LKIFDRRRASRQNFFSNFVDLIHLANLPWLTLQPSVASTKTFYNFSHEPLVLLLWRCYHEIFFDIYFLEANLQTFWWESLRGWDFSRPELVVVSGLFGGNPFVDGIFLGHNLLSQAFLVGIPSWMGFF
jgi:hypothetical protein